MTVAKRWMLTKFARSAMLFSVVPAFVAGFLIHTSPTEAQEMPTDASNFYESDKVTVRKVTFRNQYQMNVVGNLFTPKDLEERTASAAIIVGHPMGAVKEQSANLYATKLAERGFVTLSLDLSFWGESEGKPRNAVSPDIYAEDFSAAVDFLGTQPFVDRERIGVLGICGSGSFAISAAKIDPRMKAIATVSMYDMGAANRHALRQSLTLEQRKKIIAEAAEQRYVEFTVGEAKYTSGTVHELDENTHPIQREFYDFYRTPRGEFTPAGGSSKLTTHPTLSSNVKFMNFYPFNDMETISPRPMLFIAGENAHSIEFSEDAYKKAAEPKELVIVPNAGHVDLYDRVNLIPWDKLDSFFDKNLRATSEPITQITTTMKIKLILRDKTLTAKLYDTPAARDFASMLPLTLTLEDYSKTEKISDLPKKLTKQGAPAGADPSIGHIAYYVPWGNLAIFYKDFGYSDGLIILGELDNGVEALNGPNPVKVTIELVSTGDQK
jgi:fermentation-respiration switch protein FrsA (DUF1100 family)